MRTLLVYINIIFSIISFQEAIAQCSYPTPPYTSCSGLPSNKILISSGTHLNSGSIYYYDGGSETISLGSFNGGTLVICGGPLTLNGINISGTVIVTAGSSLIINGSSNLQGEGRIYNNGTLKVNGTMHINRDGIYNNGIMTLSGNLHFNSGGKMCLGNGSVFSAQSVHTNQTNAITVSSGNACLSYTQTFTGSNAITNNSNLYICQTSSATAPAGISAGSGNLTSDCVNCGYPLAVDLLTFELTQKKNQINLKWITTNEKSISHFNIDCAGADGQFQLMKTVKARGGTNMKTEYILEDNNQRIGTIYYRLSEVDLSGNSTELAVRTISIDNNNQLLIYPNPTPEYQTTKIHYQAKNDASIIEIFTSVGIKVATINLNKNTNIYEVNLPPGQYIVRLIEDHISTQIKSLVVL